MVGCLDLARHPADGSYTLATLLPTAVMQIFGSAELASVAQEVETVIKALMQDAAGAS